MRGLVVLVLMAACYDPSPLAGSPCSANGTCPASLVCTSGVCLLPGVGADALGDDAPGDSPAMDGMIDGPPAMGWSTPVALSINTSSKESDASFTPNRLELYFISTRAGGVGGDDIWYTSRDSVGDAWDTPTNVMALNSPASENSVHISADGNRLYFQSTRMSPGGDIFMAAKAGLGWGPPGPVTELNSVGAESGIALSPDELTAIVDRGSLGSRTLHVATRADATDAFGPLSAMTAINLSDDPSSPSLTNGANVVYFHADSPRNIYRSTKIGTSWSTPVPVTEVNTTMRDAAPATDEADDYMIFERENQLYETSR